MSPKPPLKSLLLFLGHLASCLALRDYHDHPLQPPDYNVRVDNGTFGYYPTHEFATFDLLAPQTNFLEWTPECDDGLFYFLTPRGWGLSQPGPLILDRDGSQIWQKHFSNDFGGQAYDFKVQKYQGQDYITFWTGDDRIRGHGSGSYYMLNQSYDLVHKIDAANNLTADLHEFLITPEGTALLTVYQVTHFDVTSLGRVFDDTSEEEPNYIWDCLIQEVAIDTGALIFEWRASEYVDLAHTYREIGQGGTKQDPFDWFHINSVEKDELGNYLISARYPHVVIYIDGKTKETIWTLGGKGNDFMDLSDGFGLNFAWQHDARFISTDMFPELYTPPPAESGVTTKLLTLFDNAAEDRNYLYGTPYARGLLLELMYPTPGSRNAFQATTSDLSELHIRDGTSNGGGQPLCEADVEKIRQINGTNTAYRVRVIKEYINPKKFRASSQGSVQLIPTSPGKDPKVFLGYGLNAVFTEFNSDGSVICDAHYGATTSWERGDIQSYRTYKFDWVGKPREPPSLGISDDLVDLFVSWNGATEVKAWQLQSSRTGKKRDWTDVVQFYKKGFETTLPLADENMQQQYLRVLALDKNGEVLEHGASNIIDIGATFTTVPALKSTLPSDISPVQIIMLLACNVLGLLVLFELYRRYLSWRHGRYYSGPLRWKKGNLYHAVSDA